MKRINVLFVAVLLFTLTIIAQSPNAFKYQAVIRDNTGNIIASKNVGLRISIIKDNIFGVNSYIETHSVQTNQYGLVNLLIGQGTPVVDSFSGIDWSTGTYFIKIEVDPTGGTTYTSAGDPVQLVSVPYALFANKAGNGFSGNYNDLTNKPSLFDGSWNSLSGKPNFAIVATSANYNDLNNLPTLFSGAYSALTGKPVLWDSTWVSIKNKPTTIAGYGVTDAFNGQYSSLTGTPSLAVVATSGSYNDLGNKPALFDSSWNAIKGKPQFSTVALTGSYVDLVNKPALWDSSWVSIKNKPAFFDGQYGSLNGTPTFAAVATSGNYSDLNNKPTLFSGNYSDLLGKPALWDSTWATIKNKPNFFDGKFSSLSGAPNFATVATSGSFTDLSNVPPLLNGDYNSLINRPTFKDSIAKYSVTLSGNQTINGNKIFNGTITSTFNANNATISNVAAPVNNKDAVNKDYINNILKLLGYTGTAKDIEGNPYLTVNIGLQTWMVENLRTTRYNDSTLIPLNTNLSQWTSLTTPYYCWYNNDSLTYSNINYGALYNYYTVSTGKLCPTGWHVPSDAEWNTLVNFLGGSTTSTGDKLREIGQAHWPNNPTSTNNSSGFTALPSGCLRADPTNPPNIFQDVAITAYWWTSTIFSLPYAYGFMLNNTPSETEQLPTYGFSVRCVKN